MLNWNRDGKAHTATAANGDVWTVENVGGNFTIQQNGEHRTHRLSLKSAKTWAQVAANYAK